MNKNTLRLKCTKIALSHQIVVIGILWMATNALAYKEDPHHQFDMTHNMTNHTDITFVQVSNVQQACDKESKERGFGGFRISVEACSFWSGNTCKVITQKTANFHTIGHEIRHCLQGNWHDMNGEIKR